jgi:hypothetical protein
MRTRRMRPGVVAALAGVLLSGFSLGLAGTSQPASAGSDHERWSDSSGCTDIVVLGARGSGQDDEDSDKTHLGLGPEVHGFYDGLVEALKPKGLTTSYLPLDYPRRAKDKLVVRESAHGNSQYLGLGRDRQEERPCAGREHPPEVPRCPDSPGWLLAGRVGTQRRCRPYS